MFNGLIREIARVSSFDGSILRLLSSHRPNLGDSIAVNGACLSVIKNYADGFSVELSPHSKGVLALENYKDRVHIEPALKYHERIEGHLVQGHIDALGKITAVEKRQKSKDLFIEVPSSFLPLISYKGAVAVDGVSLTISALFDKGFRLSLIPLSLKHTLFDEYLEGRRVNLESDLIARYLARLLSFKNEEKLNIERFAYIY